MRISFWKLCLTEIRKNWILSVLELIALFGYSMFITYLLSYANTGFREGLNGEMGIAPFLILIFTLPAIIYFSFSIERRTQSQYMLYSLPVPRTTVLLVKFVSFLTPIVILPFVFGGLHIISYFALMERGARISYSFYERNNLFYVFLHFLSIVPYVVLLSGLFCTAESLFRSIKRFTVVAAFIFIMITQALVLWASKFTLYYGELGNYLREIRISSSLNFALRIQNLTILCMYICAVGILFLGAALIIHSKFAEV
ncbi:hypothetical protein ACFL6H_02750 [Candidatus Latescibacterota bacterium]